jgi:hypothetical protein
MSQVDKAKYNFQDSIITFIETVLLQKKYKGVQVLAQQKVVSENQLCPL